MYIIFYGPYLCLFHKSPKPRTFIFSLSHRRTRVRWTIWPPTHLLTNHISEILIAELCCDLSKGLHFRPTIVRTYSGEKLDGIGLSFDRNSYLNEPVIVQFSLIFCRSLKMVIPLPPVIWKMPWIMLESNCLCTEWGSCSMTWKPKAKHVIKKEYLRKFSEK